PRLLRPLLLALILGAPSPRLLPLSGGRQERGGERRREREPRERSLGHHALDHEQEDREAERPHVLLVERDLDTLGELLAHHLLEPARHLVDAGVALLGAYDRAAGGLGNVRELRLALRRQLGRERLAGVVCPEALGFAVGADLRDGLGRAA